MRIRKGFDRRFQSGHPWVYSNELQTSPQEWTPGQTVRLEDSSGRFMAWGYGNPHSLISFRTVSRVEAEADALAAGGVTRRLARAWAFRKSIGRSALSFRLCFGEADGLPGLIIDAFRVGATLEKSTWLFVIQPHTAGAEAWVSASAEFLRAQKNPSGGSEASGIVVKREASFRKQEGLEILPPEWLSQMPQGFEVSTHPIWVPSVAAPSGALPLFCDWASGQKTGFFLDQIDNVNRLVSALKADPRFRGTDVPKKIRVLDLCCYVGQWSAQVAEVLTAMGLTVEMVLVDASADALEYAVRNVKNGRAKVSVEAKKMDALGEATREFADQTFDIVICDPPALIKSRKHEGPGRHAYLQLHTFALRVLCTGGWIVTCSCSGLLTEEDFAATWAKAEKRLSAWMHWWERGGQAADHPWNAAFSEGRYLKAWFGRRGEDVSLAGTPGDRYS